MGVVRNSNSGEKSFLKLDGTPKLKAASWIHLDVARNLASAAGLDLDKMMSDAVRAISNRFRSMCACPPT